MTTLLFRLAQYDGLDTKNFSTAALSKFTDAKKISKWAVDGVAWAVANKIMTGVGNNKMSPKTTLSFEQLAQVMKTYGALKDGNQGPVEPSPSPSPDVTKRSGNYYNQKAYPEDADDANWLTVDSDYVITDLSGPWDNCKPVTTIPNGGYYKNGHRYNKYHVCIDSVDGLPNDEEKKAIISINQHRINNGVELLIWDQGAQVFAETRAIEMRYRYENFNQFDHVRPDGSGANEVVAMVNEWSKIGILQKTYTGWLNEAGSLRGGEPLISDWGVNIDNGKDVTKGWINSPAHNNQLLDSNAHHGAVAYDGRIWCYNGIHTK